MSKRTITLIACVGVLAVVLLAYMIMTAAGVGDTPAVTTAGPDPELVLAEYDYNDVQTVYYTWNGTTLSFTYNGNVGKWEYDENKKLPINIELPTYMASALSSIQANRYIEDSDEHFADFGLDEPFMTVGIIYNDGVECEYNIGDYNATTDTFYFNVAGTNKVYSIATGLVPYFQYTLLELIEPDVLPALYSTTYTLKSVKIGEETLDDEAMTAYKSSFAQAMLSAPIGWLDGDAAKANYGLDSEELVVIEYSEAQNVSDAEGTITSTVHVDGTLTIHLGAESSEGKRYCTVNDSIVVYEIPTVVLGVVNDAAQ